MANQVGKRYVCKKCGAEFIVTRPGEGTLICCGQPMELKKQPSLAIDRGELMNQLGKRYRCEKCGTEVLCTKAGEGVVICCDNEMTPQEPRPLPSSD